MFAFAFGFGPGDVDRAWIEIIDLGFARAVDGADLEQVIAIGPQPAAEQRAVAGGRFGASPERAGSVIGHAARRKAAS